MACVEWYTVLLNIGENNGVFTTIDLVSGYWSKLTPKFIGPYKVTDISLGNIISMEDITESVNVGRLKLLTQTSPLGSYTNEYITLHYFWNS